MADDDAHPSEPRTEDHATDAASSDASLIAARVAQAHEVKGEPSCEIVTEFPERFKRTKRVFLSPPSSPGSGEPLAGATPQPMSVTQARLAPHRGHAEVILELGDVPDRDAAEKLRGW